MAEVAVQQRREQHAIQAGERARLDAKPPRQRVSCERIDEQHNTKAQHENRRSREAAKHTFFVHAHLSLVAVGEPVDQPSVSFAESARCFAVQIAVFASSLA